ncbi:cysteine hydrolase family protein [Ferrovibrio terrae]|uniref:cysteine hydrolase family protein n=1 Tax=Ferrovibrio terrae TaxID=2594003 RepID=UPI0031381E30
MTPLPRTAALLVIDLQQAIDAPYWGPRNNPAGERNIAALIAAWRSSGRPLYHIRHDSTRPDSAYRPGQPGHDFKPEAMPLPGEPVIAKRTNSAFIGTDLEARLRAARHTTLVICGVLIHNSVEATVRMAGNLGFDTHLAADATWAVDKRLLDGRVMQAEDVHALSLANLDGEYATVSTTAAVIAALD